ncbi:unnamed protein product, partial [Sphacelaria rigidula]
TSGKIDGRSRLDESEFVSLTRSDADRLHDQVSAETDPSRVGVIFPIPAASAPRGAPHGEPVSPVAAGPPAPSPASGVPAPSPAPPPPPPQATEHYSDPGSGSSYTAGSSGTHAYHSSVSTLDGSTDFAATSTGRHDAAGTAAGNGTSPGRHSAAD